MLDKTNPEHVEEANRLSSFMVHKVCVRFPVSSCVGSLSDTVFHVFCHFLFSSDCFSPGLRHFLFRSTDVVDDGRPDHG